FRMTGNLRSKASRKRWNTGSAAPFGVSEESRGWFDDAYPHVVAEFWCCSGLHELPVDSAVAFIQRHAVINVPLDASKWVPGDSGFDGNPYVPENLPEGTYDFRVGMLNPRERQAPYMFRNRRPRLRRLVLRRTNSDHVTATPALGQRSPRSHQARLGEIRNPLLLIDASKIRRCDLTE